MDSSLSAIPPARTDASEQPAVRRSIIRRLLRIIERCLAILGFFFLIYFLCFDVSLMISGSMAPTLKGNGRDGSDYVLSERVSGCFFRPKRWDLVAFHDYEGLLIMKRVVGLPNETVAMTANGDILIDGKSVPRPKPIEHIRYYCYGNLVQGNSVKLVDGYYVLGDDSRDSYDSRYNPPVQLTQIVGRPLLVVWPLSRFGFVNP